MNRSLEKFSHGKEYARRKEAVGRCSKDPICDARAANGEGTWRLIFRPPTDFSIVADGNAKSPGGGRSRTMPSPGQVRELNLCFSQTNSLTVAAPPFARDRQENRFRTLLQAGPGNFDFFLQQLLNRRGEFLLQLVIEHAGGGRREAGVNMLHLTVTAHE